MTDQQTNEVRCEIEVLEGLEAVRKRPGMYIGATNERGLRHMVYTVLDHAVAEASAGCATQARITILADAGVRVADDGCGLPVDAVDFDGTPAVEAAMTKLYCGAADPWTVGHDAVSPYHHPWLYGVGLAVVNALSARLEIEVLRQGHVWRQSYRRGVPEAPLAKGGTTDTTGTVITFWADPEIFSTTSYDADILRARFRQLACLSGLRLTFTDEREPNSEPTTYGGDLAGYVTYLNQSRNNDPIHDDIVVLEASDPDQRMKAHVAMRWTTSDEELLETFVNTILTSQGGTHAEGLRDAVTDVVARYAQQIGLREDHDLGEGEVCQGLTAAVNVWMPDPHFAGPTREYLSNPTVRTFVAKVVAEGLPAWLASHPDQAEAVARHVTTVAAIPVTTAMQDAVLSAMDDDGVVSHTVAELADRSGLPSPLVRRTLAALVKSGRVRPEPEESGDYSFTGRIRYVSPSASPGVPW